MENLYIVIMFGMLACWFYKVGMWTYDNSMYFYKQFSTFYKSKALIEKELFKNKLSIRFIQVMLFTCVLVYLGLWYISGGWKGCIVGSVLLAALLFSGYAIKSFYDWVAFGEKSSFWELDSIEKVLLSLMVVCIVMLIVLLYVLWPWQIATIGCISLSLIYFGLYKIIVKALS